MSQEDQSESSPPAQSDQVPKDTVAIGDPTPPPAAIVGMSGQSGDVLGVEIMQTREKSFAAWAGTSEDLILIFDRANSAIRKKRADESARIAKLDSFIRDHESQKYVLSAEVGGVGNLVRTGDLHAVLSSMDVREVRSLEISNTGYYLGSSGTGIRMVFGKNNYTGVDLRVRGSDPDWVSGTYDTLAQTISYGVPRWRIATSVWCDLAVGIIFTIFLVWALMLWLQPGPTLGELLTKLSTIFILSTLFGALSWAPLRKRIFKRFELLGVGQKPSGARFGIAVIGLVGLLASILGIWSYFAS